MRGQCGHVGHRTWNALTPCGGSGIGVEQAGHFAARQHPIPRGNRSREMPIRAARFWRLGQRDKQRRLGRRQASGRFREPHQTGRADAFDIAPKRRVDQVKVQDFPLGQPPFKGQCQTHLPDLTAPFARRTVLNQPRRLHGQGRGTGHNPPRAQGLPRRTQHRTGINAIMGVEPAILIGDQQVEIGRIDILNPRPHAPASVVHRIGTQQLAMAVAHLNRQFGAQVRHRRRIDPSVEPVPRHGQRPQRANKDDQGVTAHHCTVTRPASVHARWSGRYMSSTVAAGW